MTEEKKRNTNEVRDTLNRATRKANLLTEEAIEFYEKMAKDEKQSPKFRKECWDAIVERGPGKAAAQPPRKPEAARRRMVVGPISKESIGRLQNDERQTLPDRESDMEREKSFEGNDQADLG